MAILTKRACVTRRCAGARPQGACRRRACLPRRCGRSGDRSIRRNIASLSSRISAFRCVAPVGWPATLRLPPAACRARGPAPRHRPPRRSRPVRSRAARRQPARSPHCGRRAAWRRASGARAGRRRRSGGSASRAASASRPGTGARGCRRSGWQEHASIFGRSVGRVRRRRTREPSSSSCVDASIAPGSISSCRGSGRPCF